MKNIRQPTFKQGSIDVFCVRLVDRSRTICLLIETGFFTLRIIPKLFYVLQDLLHISATEFDVF